MNTINDASKLLKLLSGLAPFIDLIYERQESFLKTFVHESASDLIDVAFDDTRLRFVFILNSGQHVVNSIAIDDLVDWLYK